MLGHPQSCDLISPASPQAALSEALGVRAPARGSWGPWQPLLGGARLSSQSPSLGTSPGAPAGDAAHSPPCCSPPCPPCGGERWGGSAGCPMALYWGSAPKLGPSAPAGVYDVRANPGAAPAISLLPPFSSRLAFCRVQAVENVAAVRWAVPARDLGKGQHPVSAGRVQAGWAQGAVMEVAARGKGISKPALGRLRRGAWRGRAVLARG